MLKFDLTSHQFLHTCDPHFFSIWFLVFYSTSDILLVTFYCSNLEKKHFKTTHNDSTPFTICWPLTLRHINSFIHVILISFAYCSWCLHLLPISFWWHFTVAMWRKNTLKPPIMTQLHLQYAELWPYVTSIPSYMWSSFLFHIVSDVLLYFWYDFGDILL